MDENSAGELGLAPESSINLYMMIYFVHCILRNMQTVHVLLCFVMVKYQVIVPASFMIISLALLKSYVIASVTVKQPGRI